MDLKNIMLSKISQTKQTQQLYDFGHMQNIKLKATNEQARKTNY